MMRGSDEPGHPDLLIFVTVITLLSIGVIMVASASSVMAYDEYGDPYYFFKRQAIWAVLGIAAMIVTMNIDYRLWKRLAVPIAFGALFLLVVVLVPGIGKVVNGSRRWIGLGPVGVQPSEIAKLATVIGLSRYLSAKRGTMASFFSGLLPPLAVVGLVCGLILLEPDMGTAVAIALVSVVLLFIGGANFWHLVSLGVLASPGVWLLIAKEPYRMRRWTAFLNPWKDPLDSGFHIIQSLLALGSGGIFGLGLGRSRQKFHYLPEQHTDFIFAVLGEELGFIGAAGVVALFALFAWRGYKVALTAQDVFGSLLAAGITTMIAAQAALNIGVVSGCLPVTGMTLPFISSGGSSLTIMLAGVGILLNISRHCRVR